MGKSDAERAEMYRKQLGGLQASHNRLKQRSKDAEDMSARRGKLLDMMSAHIARSLISGRVDAEGGRSLLREYRKLEGK